MGHGSIEHRTWGMRRDEPFGRLRVNSLGGRARWGQRTEGNYALGTESA
jgi:hypothetical protein